MSAAQNIPIRNGASASAAVTNSFDPSTSPTATFHSPSSSFSAIHRAVSSAKQLKPFNTQDVKVLLLENVNVTGQDILRKQGYQVEALKSSLPEDQLIQKIRYVARKAHVV